LLAPKTEGALLFERTTGDVARLSEIAHPVVEDRNAVQRSERMMRKIDPFEERLGTLEISEPRSVLSKQPKKVSARVQRVGEHFLIAGGGRDGHRFLVQSARAGIVACRFHDRPATIEEARLQPSSSRVRHERSRKVDLRFCRRAIPL